MFGSHNGSQSQSMHHHRNTMKTIGENTQNRERNQSVVERTGERILKRKFLTEGISSYPALFKEAGYENDKLLMHNRLRNKVRFSGGREG